MCQFNLAPGNLKSKKLEEKIERDVKFVFTFFILRLVIEKIHSAMVQPCGIAVQYGLIRYGNHQLKERLTHNLSFSITNLKVLLNRRCDIDKYPEIIYGWCLMWCIYLIVALCLHFPDEPILISKYNLSDAYQRIAHQTTSAV